MWQQPCLPHAGLFAAARALGISAMHSGHDHDNNYEGVLQGVRLAYGHKTGAALLCSTSPCSLPSGLGSWHAADWRALGLLRLPGAAGSTAVKRMLQQLRFYPLKGRENPAGYGSYGPPPGWGHGARVVLLRAGQEPSQAETWIRLENGARVDQSPNPQYKRAAQRVCEAGARVHTPKVCGCVVALQPGGMWIVRAD